MKTVEEMQEAIKLFEQQRDIAYENGLDQVGDIYSQKVRELKDEIEATQNREHTEVKSDAPFRHTLYFFGTACRDHLKTQLEDNTEDSPKNYWYNCSGCERYCQVAIRPGYIGLNEDGMTVYFPSNEIGGGNID